MTETNTATLEAPAKRTPARTSAPANRDSGFQVPKFAMDAIGAQATRVSDILTAAADTIDELNTASLPDTARNFAGTASSKLRGLADRATEDEAARLVEALQRTAASHPLATASIGAAIGAALGMALSRLSRPAKG